jgi:lipid-A-disaccharide synthase-like uncharacterized protein
VINMNRGTIFISAMKLSRIQKILTTLAALICTLLLPATVLAAQDDYQSFAGWIHELLGQMKTPLFWFGIFAQFMFFMRFIWQWIVSEQRRRSTIPVVFWYFSLAGGVAMFIYACLRADLVIMLGQAMACVIYTRNLMLIYGRAAQRKQAGLSSEELGSSVDNKDLPD